MKNLLLRYIFTGIITFLLFASCSDKTHPITHPQFEGNFEFQSLTVEDIVSGSSYITSPRLGDHTYLYSGSKNNYHCDFTLIDFTSYYALISYPEIFSDSGMVDSMKLKIYLADTTVLSIPEISLTYLNDEIDSIFNEDETLYSEFDPNVFPDAISLGEFQLSEEDTNSTVNSIELMINDSTIINSLLFYSDDTSKCFLLSQTESSDFIKMYSSESYYKPEFYFYYTVTDSTDSSYVSSFYLPVLQDVSLINPPEFSNLPQDSLYIGGSLFESILKFDLDPFLVLPEQFILKEDSYLYLNTPFSNGSVTVNILAYSLLDSVVDNGHFYSVEEEYPVDKSVFIPTWIENGKLKIRIQSYLQFALTEEMEHFGIILQGSMQNDPFSILSIEKPDSGFSNISIEYVSN